MDALDPGMVPDREGAIAKRMPFAMKYLSFENSGLTLTVNPREAQHLEIKLEK